MMLEKNVTEFIKELSSASPVPGGGGACAAVGAFAAALGMMVANLTTGKKRYAEVEDEIRDVRDRLTELISELEELVDKDAAAFEPLAEAYGLPKETAEEREQKERIMEKALYDASVVPLEIMRTIHKAMKLLSVLEEKGSRIAVSDAGVGILFAQAALNGASLNIFINTKLMKDRERAEELNHKADALIEAGECLREEVYQSVIGKIR
ncbi:cyclodeaminase/cyclohydrolase family protein [Lachnospiraceae bacterium 62-26]